MKWIGFFLFLFLILPVYSDAEELQKKSLDISLSVAAAFPGVIVASFEEDFPPDQTMMFSNTVSPGLKMAADYYPPAIGWLAPSIAVHYAPLFLPQDIDLGYWGGRDHFLPKNDIHLVEVEGGIRSRFFIDGVWTIEPGLFLGYCHTFSSSPDAVNNGFMLDVNTEIQRRYPGFHLLFTIGLMTQLYGGVEELAYIRSFPVAYLAAGLGI